MKYCRLCSIILYLFLSVHFLSAQTRDPVALWFWGDRSPASVIGVPNNLVMKGAPFTATYRTYIRLRENGGQQLSFWYRNIVDSQSESPDGTFANDSCSAFRILGATVADGGTIPNGSVVTGSVRQVKWKGYLSKNVAKGESFWSDTVTVTIPEGHCLAFTWTVEKQSTLNAIPHAYENQYSCFFASGAVSAQVSNSGFTSTGSFAVVPNAIGYKKACRKVIGFIGNSITQGFSTSMNSYSFWVSQAAAALGSDYGVWNLGSGWAQARDAATNKAWLSKLKYCDEAVISLGVNDFRNGATADQVMGYITNIVTSLRQINPNKKIILCTVPPFNFTGTAESHWRTINATIRSNPPAGVYRVFDIASLFSQSAPNENMANPLYGDGHPNDLGGRMAGQAFATFYLDTAAIPTAPPSSPQQIFPSENATSIPTNTTISWHRASTAAAYDVQTSTDPLFSTLFTDLKGLTDTSTVISGLNNATAYYWRVRASNSMGAGQWSTVWTFTTEDASVVPVTDSNEVLIRFDPSVMSVTSSSSYTTNQLPIRAVNGDGLIDSKKHSNHQYGDMMWMSRNGDVSGAWFEIDLGSQKELKRMHLWNYNQLSGTNRGIRNCDILYRNSSTESWTVCATNISLSRANGTSSYEGDTYQFCDGISARHVRIKVINNFGTDSYGNYVGISEMQLFEALTDPTPLTPVIINPVDSRYDAASVPVFSWNRSTGAKHYDVQIARDSLFTVIADQVRQLPDTMYTSPVVFDRTLKYYWRVRAVGEVEESDWSIAGTFSFKQPNAVPIHYSAVLLTMIMLFMISLFTIRKADVRK